MNQYQKFIHLSRYARWREDLQRRETWGETVDRYMSWLNKQIQKHGSRLTDEEQKMIVSHIRELSVMPSMRCMMTAGPALERDNAAGYNCSYLQVSDIRAFDETMYILLCGVGVGFSVERQYICHLPVIPEMPRMIDDTIVVEDSKIGWCEAFRRLIRYLYEGKIPQLNYNKLRPAGAPLKTFGGVSSGPGPLKDLFDFTISTFCNAKGRKLSSIECHDILCKIGEIVIVGGVRRSALISLSNLSDDRMRDAKSGAWWQDNPQRTLANNSVAYTEKPDIHRFMKEWLALYESKSGERGIFNREAAIKKVSQIGRDSLHEFGLNPCGEIILRPCQFCNLSEVVIRPGSTVKSLEIPVVVAAILGTVQSTLTDFRYLRSQWKANTEEERLLGVSLTGIMDNHVFYNTPSPADLNILKELAVRTNKEWAKRLGINKSAAIATVKPSGTVSQLVGCSPGIHPQFSSGYYIRRVQADVNDPLTKYMIENKFPHEKLRGRENTVVFSFPMKGNHNILVDKDSLRAIDHLELWKKYKDYWCDHNPSITVNVRDREWLDVAAWVYRHFDEISGVSFLPYSDHIYAQAPYERCSEKDYKILVASMPDVDWKFGERKDNTTASQEFACTAGKCEVI